MKIEVFNDFNEELQAIWRPFEPQSNSLPFHSFEWQRYWNELVGQPRYKISICVVVVSNMDKVTRAIFPFGINRVLGARVLSFLGGEEADYSAPLFAMDINSTEFSDIWNKVLRVVPTHDLVFFKNMPKTIKKIDNFLLENIETKKSGMSYSITLPGSFSDYSLRISKSMLKDNRRMVRRLSEKGDLIFKVIDKPNEFKKIIEVMISQKELRYKLSGARNIFQSESVKNFYKNIFILLDRGFNVHLSALMLDDEILATHLGILDRDCFYYLMPTFNHDDKWMKFSLGRIHLEKLINWSVDNGVAHFDFTIGGESYKSNWCDSEMLIYDHLKIKSMRGAICFFSMHALKFIKSQPLLKKSAVKLLSLFHIIKYKLS